VPWQAARSVSRWDAAKAVKGRARWTQIVREAAKQAHRAWVPEVSEASTSAQIAQRAAVTPTLVLEPGAAESLSTGMRELRDAPEILLVVGPEGGIDAAELESFAAAGAHPVRLGDGVLRTSPAGPAALAAIEALLGRW
jgi:16S rRNA (uracil1498-N3)-methyltransferase